MNPDAYRVGQLAQRLAGFHYPYSAALEVARDPGAAMLLAPPREPGKIVWEGRVPYRDGVSVQRYDLPHYLALSAEPDAAEEFGRAFYAGALLAVGDALSAYGYFDHAPELELVYHLRNGIAHGNRFTFTAAGRRRLSRYPAHNRLSWHRTPTPMDVTLQLARTRVLFDFIGPAETHDLLDGVGVYLVRMGNGDSLRP